MTLVSSIFISISIHIKDSPVAPSLLAGTIDLELEYRKRRVDEHGPIGREVRRGGSAAGGHDAWEA
jgi:hypothetical protein